ncbi:MAG: hypothetical protein WC532_07830 [Candidatus Omnitrophota bacterium]
MEEKQRYLGYEIILTFCMLLSCVMLLGQALPVLGPYLCVAAAAGFLFSWFIRNRPLPFTYAGINAGAVIICGWVIYLLSMSSFFYREIVMISVKGVLVMEVLLAFGANFPLVLSSAQLLSIPVFISSPLFGNVSHPAYFVFVALYIICWLGICRVKLFFSGADSGEQSVGSRHSIAALILLFAAVIFVALAVFSAVAWKELDQGGLFWQEEMESKFNLEDDLEKEYYNLQEQIGNKVSSLATGAGAVEGSRELVFLFSPLTNDSLDIVEVDRAQEGLISYLGTPGPGIEGDDAEHLVKRIEEYIDKRIRLNVIWNKNAVANRLRSNPFSLREKFQGMNLANKMQYSPDSKETRALERQGSSLMDRTNSPVAQEERNKLKDLFNRLRAWKIFAAYRQKISGLSKAAAALEEPAKTESSALLSEIAKAVFLPELKLAKKKISDFKDASAGTQEELAEGLAEAVRLKQEIFISYEGRKLAVEAEELKDLIRETCNSENAEGFIANAQQLKSALPADGAIALFRVMSLAKAELLIDEELQNVSRLIADSALSANQAAAFFKDFSALGSVKDMEKLFADARWLENKIIELRQQALLEAKAANTLVQAVANIRELVAFIIENSVAAGEEAVKAPDKKDASIISALMGDLDKAETAEEVESIKDKLDEVLSAKTVKTGTLVVSPDSLELAVGEEEKLEAFFLYSDGSQEDVTLSAQWDSSHGGVASVSAGIVSALSEGEAEVHASADGSISNPCRVKVNPARLISIAVFPPEAVIPIRGKLSLRAEAYYSDSSHKDVTDLVEWHNDKPRIARVSSGGEVFALWGGLAILKAEYMEISSLPVNIRVVFTLAWIFEQIGKFLFSLLAALALIFTAFYMIAEKKRNKLKELLDQDNRQFVIKLYANLADVLAVCGFCNHDHLPPLSFAVVIETAYGIKENALLKLTAEYEEAKYSHHIIEKENALAALGYYNNVLDALCKHPGKLRFLRAYAAGLACRVPFGKM